MQLRDDMGELLAHDHGELDKLLRELLVAFQTGEAPDIHQRLDRFWARLAVHIRAEHLVLFPAILHALSRGIQGAPSLTEAEQTIAELRSDHDFFMCELARAIKSLRGLLNDSDNERRPKKLETVAAIVGSVGGRLATHNKVEEEGIYVWVGLVLNDTKQSELAVRVETELKKMPPRFEAQMW